MRSKGTPLESKDTPLGSKSTPMKSKGRTPIKPVTKYKEAGCQTSPGFVKRTRQSNGDSASNTNAKDEEEVYKRDNLQIKFFKLVSRSPVAGFLPFATINLLSLKRIRDSDVKNNCIIMKLKK